MLKETRIEYERCRNAADNSRSGTLSGRRAKLGRAYQEAGYQLYQDERTWLQPDVSFLSAERIKLPETAKYPVRSPDIAFEVISPSESATDVENKTDAYLAAGAKAVVLIYPRLRKIKVVHPGGRSIALQDGETLALPEIPPGGASRSPTFLPSRAFPHAITGLAITS